MATRLGVGHSSRRGSLAGARPRRASPPILVAHRNASGGVRGSECGLRRVVGVSDRHQLGERVRGVVGRREQTGAAPMSQPGGSGAGIPEMPRPAYLLVWDMVKSTV